MPSRLRKRFLAEEMNERVRELIMGAVQERAGNSTVAIRKFEFNVFNVTLDFDHQLAVIEDILDPTDAGELKVALPEFLSWLTSAPSRE